MFRLDRRARSDQQAAQDLRQAQADLRNFYVSVDPCTTATAHPHLPVSSFWYWLANGFSLYGSYIAYRGGFYPRLVFLSMGLFFVDTRIYMSPRRVDKSRVFQPALDVGTAREEGVQESVLAEHRPRCFETATVDPALQNHVRKVSGTSHVARVRQTSMRTPFLKVRP